MRQPSGPPLPRAATQEYALMWEAMNSKTNHAYVLFARSGADIFLFYCCALACEHPKFRQGGAVRQMTRAYRRPRPGMHNRTKREDRQWGQVDSSGLHPPGRHSDRWSCWITLARCKPRRAGSPLSTRGGCAVRALHSTG
ncbi:hypothetical protein L227DRAFT_159491 [Lentinus tigrinus ALCF2SS1-6]|uniref:Uncharacterized protein n=1 Tax=Lentinus tigrinus ALCF2SS1-6 TaxID=1328759 RepID=A0A5C2S8C6_9APHY|nr:hypothetical protein L227DRAFT_159491 [Lentinus tigrinus ALCF2SS1-6]